MFANSDNPVKSQQNSDEAALVLSHFDFESKSSELPTIYLLTTSTFDIGILPLIIEYLQPVIDQKNFFEVLDEYRVFDGVESNMESRDEYIKKEAKYSALWKIAAHGNMGCLNYLLEHYPDCNDGFPGAIDSAAENRYTYVIERLLEEVAEEKKPDLIGRVFEVAINRLDFGVFKWLMLRHRNALEKYEEAYLESEKKLSAEQRKPPIGMNIQLKTVCRFTLNPEKNPFIALYEHGRVIAFDKQQHQPKIEVLGDEVKPAGGIALDDRPGSLVGEHTDNHNHLDNEGKSNHSKVVLTAVSFSAPESQPSSCCSCSLFLKILSANEMVGGIFLLILLQTPIGIAAGVTLFAASALTFFAAKKQDAFNEEMMIPSSALLTLPRSG